MAFEIHTKEYVEGFNKATRLYRKLPWWCRLWGKPFARTSINYITEECWIEYQEGKPNDTTR